MRVVCVSIKCIYCEKTFKNHAVLKKHMRKKKHFKINAKDTSYDQFYMINYLVMCTFFTFCKTFNKHICYFVVERRNLVRTGRFLRRKRTRTTMTLRQRQRAKQKKSMYALSVRQSECERECTITCHRM